MRRLEVPRIISDVITLSGHGESAAACVVTVQLRKGED